MIPILYESTETVFTSNGLGRLSSAIECTITEERNGVYELYMSYPTNGVHYADLSLDRMIYAQPGDGRSNQAFRIYKITKPLNGIVSVYAEHISYALNKVIVSPFTAGSLGAALAGLEYNAIGTMNYVFWTDKTVVADFAVEQPQSIRACLAGQQGSILDIYGGEYEFDMFTVRLYQNRGQNSGATLRYGKNITDITADADMSETYTAIVPFWRSQDEVMLLSEKVVSAQTQYSQQMTKAVDFSSEWQDKPTEAQLRARAEAYLAANAGWHIKQNVSVDFVNLYQTSEYADYAPLQRVRLCDTVSVIYEPLGIETTAKVVKTVYNVLLDRYDEIEVGDAAANMSGAVAEVADIQTADLTTTSMLQKAVEHATELITGGLGGYVVIKPNANGEPEEILIMDTPDIDTAVNVWRWNQNGLGHSSTGYAGPFTTAITADGQIVADMITTGWLNANRIRAGILTALSGYVQFNLDTGFIYCHDLSLPLWGSSGRYEAIQMDGLGFRFCDPNGVTKTWLDGQGLHRYFDLDSTQYGIWVASSGTSPYYDVSVQLSPQQIYVNTGTGVLDLSDAPIKVGSYTAPGTEAATFTDGNGYTHTFLFRNGIMVQHTVT